MTQEEEKHYGYGKKPIWKMVLIYLVVGLVVYGLIYYFLYAKKGGYNYNTSPSSYATPTAEIVNVADAQLPDAFPKDFPIYPGAEIISTVSNNQNGTDNGFLVTFTAPDGHGLNKLVPFYKNGLAASGWTITSSFNSDTIQTWAIAKGTTEGSVSITAQKDQTTIEVALGEKK